MYLMFLGPFQEGGDFRDEGISGPRRFLDKVWALVGDAYRTHADDEVRHETLVKDHQTVKRVTEGMEDCAQHQHRGADGAGERAPRGHLHAADAGGGAGDHARAICAALRGGELGSGSDTTRSIFDARWPAWDEGLVVEDQVEVAVQVNGKTRGKVTVPRDADQETLAAASAKPRL